MKVAVLGFGKEGRAAHDYWSDKGDEIVIHDQNNVTDVAEAQTGQEYLAKLDQYDLIVRSPSVHPRDIIDANPETLDILNKVTTNTNEFFEVCPTKNIIGITGTKGKGTTSSLVAEMLRQVGKTVHLGGNIGIAPLEMLKNSIKADDWVVLELSNFQLIDIKHSPPLAVCLMVEPEHQDWHPNVNEYVEAKQQLFRWQKSDDNAIFYPVNTLSNQVVSVTKAKKIPYFAEPGALVKNDRIVIEDTYICDAKDIKLPGEHNWQNVCAAVTAVWQVTKEPELIGDAIKNFSGLPFRLEFMREINGVKYINDSFGTTPETAIVAIKAFTQPKVVILGGSDKGSSYQELAETVASGNVKKAIVIGDTGAKIAEELRKVGFDQIIEGKNTMPAVVEQAAKESASGDVVLLSTGSASFGMFKNYQDRGEQFNSAVKSLA